MSEPIRYRLSHLHHLSLVADVGRYADRFPTGSVPHLRCRRLGGFKITIDGDNRRTRFGESDTRCRTDSVSAARDDCDSPC
ncbi:hypothetical protein HAL_31100 [Haladaptatus sp. T7]|nr:hypothetical protein HAL_31100 [Haladaptatus sp. T7]